MKLLLLGLGSCAAIDVVTILQKQRQNIKDLQVTVEGQRSKEGAKPWETMHMRFIVSGEVDKDKLQNAAKISIEKYCGVHATLSKTVNITWDIQLE